jgi:hypothetical protein
LRLLDQLNQWGLEGQLHQPDQLRLSHQLDLLGLRDQYPPQ